MKHIDFVNMKTSERDELTGEIREVNLPYDPLPENFDLFLVNDTHLGNRAMSRGTVEKVVRIIKAKKHSYVAFQGDQLETIGVTDPRFDLTVHAHQYARFNAQRNAFIELFSPVGDRVLWILDGNHERHIHNIYLPNLDIAEKFNTVYANGMLVKALFGDWRLASWHGHGSVGSRAGDELQRSTNLLIALKRNLRNLPVDDCDIVACGHYHQCLLHPPENKLILVSEGLDLKNYYTQPGRVYIGDPADGVYRIHDSDRWWMCCGGFLKAYSEDMPSYTEDWGLQATEMGYGHIQVEKGKPKLVEVVKMV
jgi:predicted phosphodiesterase